MTLMILGLALWFLSHTFRRIAPGLRAAMGDVPGKAILSVLSLLALIMIVKGFRAAPYVEVWSPPAFLRHINNLLMLVAVFLVNLGFSRGVVRTRIRHPMLTATKTWAVAHLLVNGDLAGIVLFTGLFAWALADLILINRQTGPWAPPAAGPVRNDLIYGAISLGLFAGIGALHGWLGRWPFP